MFPPLYLIIVTDVSLVEVVCHVDQFLVGEGGVVQLALVLGLFALFFVALQNNNNTVVYLWIFWISIPSLTAKLRRH